VLVELEERGSIGILHFRRPQRSNALNRALLEQFLRFQESFRSATHLRTLVTVGEGKGYCAGSDLQELAGQTPEQAFREQIFEGRVCRNLLSLPVPTIAAVHGYALGGGLCLAAYHDFRVVATRARLGLPEVKLGWNPTFGMRRVEQIVGTTKATRWAGLGEEFIASGLLARGFATTLVRDERRVLHAALQLARRLASLPAAGFTALKAGQWRELGRMFAQADEFATRQFQGCFRGDAAQASARLYNKDFSATRGRR
jgi:enoyl-CoA hydratase